MVTYEQLEVTYGKVIVRHNEDGTDTFIPMNEENSDYQAYLASLEEGTAQQPEGNI